LPAITIERDGSITPDTGLIRKTGNTYTMTSDIVKEYVIKIDCDNIIFDGAGHVLNCTYPQREHYGGTTDDNGITIMDADNVIVKDIEIVGITYTNYQSVLLNNCTSCTLLKVKADNVLIQGGSLNAIVECDFKYGITGEYVTPTPTLITTPPAEDRNAPHLDPIYYLLPISVIVAVAILAVLLLRHQKTSKSK